ncbi:MAG: hypothetical protein IPG79_16730 [Saprospiraceae bacterium]|nr:hypothetical protein [Saprospiraceae bacterium]
MRNDFVNLNLGKVLTVKEISKLPWVIKNLPKIKDCMNSINSRDSIMYTYCKELNRSSISLEHMKMLSSFLNYFVNRGPEGKGGRREILL